MADNLEQQVCKKWIETVRTLIEEQWADGLSTDAAERVLAQELSWLKSLDEKLANGRKHGRLLTRTARTRERSGRKRMGVDRDRFGRWRLSWSRERWC